MEIPRTKEEMERAAYSLSHVSKIFPHIKPNTLQVQVGREVIIPAVQSTGQGHPALFSYLNLIEIGLVNILSARGIDKHQFLKALLNSGRKNNPDRVPLAEFMRAFDFSRFLLMPGGMRVMVHGDEQVNQDDPRPLYYYKQLEELKQLSALHGIMDWFVVDTGILKKYVDSKLQEL